MVRWLVVAALGALSMTLQACGKGDDASAAAHGLLTAAQSSDAKGFEAWLDRPALRAGLREQMIAVAHRNGLDVGGPSDSVLDRMIDPQALKLVQAGGGPPLTGPPSLAQVSLMMKTLGKDHACVHDLTPQQTCLLTFAREKPGWRLVDMPPGDVTVAVPPEPAKKG